MKKVFYNKLIRDKIPEKLRNIHKAFEIRKLDEDEFQKALLEKLKEESSGVANAQSREELIGELADLQAVMDEVKKNQGISLEEMDAVIKSNQDKKGGFDEKIWLIWSEDDGYKSNEGSNLTEKPIPELSAEAKSFKLGKYRHYKGGEYETIGIGRYSETLEEVVVYRALYDDGSVWVRPLAMFVEDVEIDGERKPRFTYIS